MMMFAKRNHLVVSVILLLSSSVLCTDKLVVENADTNPSVLGTKKTERGNVDIKSTGAARWKFNEKYVHVASTDTNKPSRIRTRYSDAVSSETKPHGSQERYADAEPIGNKLLKTKARYVLEESKLNQKNDGSVDEGLSPVGLGRSQVKFADVADTGRRKTQVKYADVADNAQMETKMKFADEAVTGLRETQVKFANVADTGQIETHQQVKYADVADTGHRKTQVKYADVADTGQRKTQAKYADVADTGQRKTQVRYADVTDTGQRKEKVKYADLADTGQRKTQVKYADVADTGQRKTQVKYADVADTGQRKTQAKYADVADTGQRKTQVKYPDVSDTIKRKAKIKYSDEEDTAQHIKMTCANDETMQEDLKQIQETYEKYIKERRRSSHRWKPKEMHVEDEPTKAKESTPSRFSNIGVTGTAIRKRIQSKSERPAASRQCESSCCGGGCGGGGRGGISLCCTEQDCCDAEGGNSADNRKQMTCLAQSMAQEAQAASDAQVGAGLQAAHQVKCQLAEKACQASLSAQAALAGKKAIVEATEGQISDAQAVLEEELVGLCNLQNAAEEASQLLCNAREQVKVLTSSYELAQAYACKTASFARKMESILCEKELLIDCAERQIEEMCCQLKGAQCELDETCKSAQCAAQSAQQARQNVCRCRRKAHKGTDGEESAAKGKVNDEKAASAHGKSKATNRAPKSRACCGSKGGPRCETVCCDFSGASAESCRAQQVNEAQCAAQAAEAASESQQEAGKQAAYQVKSQLAEKACQASLSAQAALAGKQATVDHLQDQIRDAQAVLEEEQTTLEVTRFTTEIANQEACRATQQLNAVVCDLKAAQASECEMAKTSASVDCLRDQKAALVDEINAQIDQFMCQLKAAEQELACTCEAAKCAADAACQAQQSALRNKRLTKMRNAQLKRVRCIQARAKTREKRRPPH